MAKLTKTSHIKHGAMSFRPMRESEDKQIIYHASNSRMYKCPCGKTDNWGRAGNVTSEKRCPKCRLTHIRGNQYCEVTETP